MPEYERVLKICALIMRARITTHPFDVERWLKLADKLDRNMPVTVRDIINLEI